jgi:hypothetical protein
MQIEKFTRKISLPAFNAILLIVQTAASDGETIGTVPVSVGANEYQAHPLPVCELFPVNVTSAILIDAVTRK